MSSSSSGSYALAALGVAGGFTVALDEEKYCGDLVMNIDARGWSFRFALDARDNLQRMLTFLHEQNGQFVSLEIVIGSFFGIPVRLIKDDEYADRFWLRTSEDPSQVDFELLADDLTEFIAAVTLAAEDFQN